MGKAVWILCGKGNNGGDGFVIARHLHNMGADVRIVLVARIEECARGEGEAAVNFRILRRMGLPIREVLLPDEARALAAELAGAELLVDALLGTGLSGEVREPMRTLIEEINRSARPVLAVDIPSGLCANTGAVLGAAVRATRTATFAAAKVGFFRGEGPAHVGELRIIDIGIPRELRARMRSSC